MSIDTLKIPYEKVNPNGGAIAFGHPLGATGARQVATAYNECKRSGAKSALSVLSRGRGPLLTSFRRSLRYFHVHRIRARYGRGVYERAVAGASREERKGEEGVLCISGRRRESLILNCSSRVLVLNCFCGVHGSARCADCSETQEKEGGERRRASRRELQSRTKHSSFASPLPPPLPVTSLPCVVSTPAHRPASTEESAQSLSHSSCVPAPLSSPHLTLPLHTVRLSLQVRPLPLPLLSSPSLLPPPSPSQDLTRGDRHSDLSRESSCAGTRVGADAWLGQRCHNPSVEPCKNKKWFEVRSVRSWGGGGELMVVVSDAVLLRPSRALPSFLLLY